ncbi:hypothetical protein D3C71_1764930 [compost metagenome]
MRFDHILGIGKPQAMPLYDMSLFTVYTIKFFKYSFAFFGCNTSAVVFYFNTYIIIFSTRSNTYPLPTIFNRIIQHVTNCTFQVEGISLYDSVRYSTQYFQHPFLHNNSRLVFCNYILQ